MPVIFGTSRTRPGATRSSVGRSWSTNAGVVGGHRIAGLESHLGGGAVALGDALDDPPHA